MTVGDDGLLGATPCRGRWRRLGAPPPERRETIRDIVVSGPGDDDVESGRESFGTGRPDGRAGTVRQGRVP